MFALGLDLSLRGTGVCLLDDSLQPVVVETLKNKLRGAPRLVYVRDCIADLLIAPDMAIAIEGYAYRAQGKVFELGELGGVVRALICDRNTVSPLIVPPLSLKKWVSGTGRGGKLPVGIALYREFGIRFKDDNQADAYGLALVAKHYFGHHMFPQKHRQDVICALQKEDDV